MDFLLPIIIVVLLLMIMSNVNTKFQSLQDSVSRLHEKINELNKEIKLKEKSPNEAIKEVFREEPPAKKPEISIQESKPIFEAEKTIPVVRKLAHQEDDLKKLYSIHHLLLKKNLLLFRKNHGLKNSKKTIPI